MKKQFVLDIFDKSNNYFDVLGDITNNNNIIISSKLSLVNHAWQCGYEIYLVSAINGNIYNIRDLTVKELRSLHNIQHLIQSGEFDDKIDLGYKFYRGSNG